MRTMTWRDGMAGLLACAIGLGGATAVRADTASAVRLAPIVVTATKRPEPLRNVPAAAAALGHAVLELRAEADGASLLRLRRT